MPRAGRPVLPILLTVLVAVAGPIAALPAPAAARLDVIFEPGTDPAQIMAQIQRLQGTMRDRAGDVWLIELPDPGRAESLYGAGALIISRAALRFGCFSQPISLLAAPD